MAERQVRLRGLPVAIALGLAFTTACATSVRSTRTEEYDPAALAVSNYWTGVDFAVFVTAVALVIIAWAIAYAISERAKYADRRKGHDQ